MPLLRTWFELNQTIVQFVYGQVFFVLGLAIVWQSRRHSRLDLARSLGWLGAFGLAHGIHEWGDIFIPMQAGYLSQPWVEVLLLAQVILLALSFAFLFQFGATLLSSFDARLRWLQVVPGTVLIAWMAVFLWTSQVLRWPPSQLVIYGNDWARYTLGLPGALIAASGLWWQSRQLVEMPSYRRIARPFEVAALVLAAYALLGGILGPAAPFFPASAVNQQMVLDSLGVPVQALRSLAGLILVISVVRGLLVFEVEIDRRIEEMESAQLLVAERERISRELHDGAIQTVYTAGLIAESIRKRMADGDPLAPRVDRVVAALQQAVVDLRQFITQLESDREGIDLMETLRRLAADSYLQSLAEVNVALCCEEEDPFPSARATHVVAIVTEALSNVARHAQPRHVWIVAQRENGQLRVIVEDDGTGFSLATKGTGFGLRNMRDRARLLGGTLSIDQRAPQGTQVTLEVPWEDRS